MRVSIKAEIRSPQRAEFGSTVNPMLHRLFTMWLRRGCGGNFKRIHRNSTANALFKADPNKHEIVNTPNYWKGVDY